MSDDAPPATHNAISEAELFSQLCLLHEHKQQLWRAQRRNTPRGSASETYSALLSAYGLRADTLKQASRMLEATVQRRIMETLVQLGGFAVGDEVLVYRQRPGRVRSIQNGLLYVAHNDSRKPANSNHLSADNAIRLETARGLHRHGIYTRTVRETRPFRLYVVVKTYEEMEDNELLSELPAIPHVCAPCAELVRELYERRPAAEASSP